jgi:hypothetical protein
MLLRLAELEDEKNYNSPPSEQKNMKPSFAFLQHAKTIIHSISVFFISPQQSQPPMIVPVAASADLDSLNVYG